MKIDLSLQPKQRELLELIRDHRATVIGVGGGRGSAKSSGADRCAIALMAERPGMAVCFVTRMWTQQMLPFHIEAIRRDFPALAKGLASTPPAVLRMPNGSRLEFKYAQTYDAVEENFRSGNYDLIICDQSEQFSLREIVEMRKAARSRGGKPAKIVLLFNMRGSGIADLRKWFLYREVGREDPEDFVFLRMSPWDNIVWVLDALRQDGYTMADYYRWTDEQRKSYAAERGPYTKQLASDDPVISRADWEGDWDSLEGAYFANSFDLESTRINADMVELLRKPWASHWLAMDYGKSHYTAVYWNFRTTLSPSDTTKILGWSVPEPLNAVVTTREMIVNELTSTELARMVVQATPAVERPKLKAFFLSPECVTEDPNSVGSQMSKELRGVGMPCPVKADNERIGGASLMSKLLKGTKWHGIDPEDGKPVSDVWLISSECVELLKTIPILMRDPKNLDDVLKTDKSTARMEQDVYDSCRYGLKSMLAPRKKTPDDVYQERMEETSGAERMMVAFRHAMRQRQRHERRQVLPPSWRANLR